MDKQALIMQFQTGSWAAQQNTEGMTHEDTLTSAVSAGSTLNWVLGHMLRARHGAVLLTGQEEPFKIERYAAYSGRESEPWSADTAVSLDTLLSDLNKTTEMLAQGLEAMPQDAAEAKASFSPTGNPNETVGSLLATFAFHDAYHTGQLGILRRVAGRPGAIAVPDGG